MYLTKEVKGEIFAKHGGSAANTGSAEGQIALFTFRISHLTEHLKKNRHDYNTERSLVLLVGKRRRLLDYLKKTEITKMKKCYNRQHLFLYQMKGVYTCRKSIFNAAKDCDLDSFNKCNKYKPMPI